VRSVHLNAISKAICENASVSSEKYSPRRRRMMTPMTVASTAEKAIAKTMAAISLFRNLSIDTAVA
jgi:hypothetical protein